MNKPDWMSEAMWRAVRTIFQIASGFVLAALLVVLTGYQQTHVFDWSVLYYDGLVAGIAAVVAWAMNRPKA
jgi:hypothetical protein